MGILEEYKQKRDKILQMGGHKEIEKQHEKGSWTARERIEYFFDPDTFTEIGLFVKHRTTAFGLDKKEFPAEGVVVGFGRVNGRIVMTAAEDYTTMAGTFGEYHGKKFSEAIEMAKDMGVPFVGMNDSAGARLQEGMDTLQSYAWLFRSQILASGIIPQIALIMGPCIGGQAYHPVMQDFVFQNRKTGRMGIASPAFVKTQTGEEIDLDTLCGTDAHAIKSGETHVVAEDDQDCLDKAKALLDFLPSNNKMEERRKTYRDPDDDPYREIPELNNMVPDDPLIAYDMHEIIYRIIDNGYFFEIFRDFAPNVIVGFARFGGRPAGIVASQPSFAAGAIDCDAADKIARFVRFCDMFNIPLINLHDVPGYWIGSSEEWKGILRHGAKMIYSYIDATVPKITVIVRKSFAGAYTGMCCKDTGADFMFAWPGARVCIVGAETAASIIFAREIKEASNPEEMKAKRIGEYRQLFENPYCGAARGFIDDVIMPSDTRKIINKALDLLENKAVVRLPRKYSNINL
jgi:acetyl-CoA carboxylase carboxyltransferase component